ncbi:MAG: T9SS type A sorting domain-containing protein, partial [Bacteroidetes bacterium]|nr:T9SS type A sorting domain-containing protein [Bacteroidota bacterium]
GGGNAYSAVRYVRLNPFTRTILEDAAMGLDGFWHMWPALMVDADKNVVVTFSRSGTTEFVGAFLSGRKDTDPPGLSPSLVLKAGEANYVKTVNIIPLRNRWGDYMGIALDPVDSNAIWAHTQYAASPANTWGTWVGMVKMGPLPGAFIAVAPTTLAFPQAEVGTSGDTLSFVITNSGTDTLVISSFTTSGLNYTLVTMPTTPFSIASLASDTFQVALTPVTAGDLEDSVVISSNDMLNPVVSIRLLGKGVLIVQAQPGVMYGTTAGSSPELLTINEATGVATSVAPTVPGEIHGLTVRPTSNELYGSRASTSTTFLYRLSSADGEGILASTIPVGSMRAIAFTEDDLLYGATTAGDLYRVIPETGDTTYVGTASGVNYSSLVFSPTSGELWASVRPLFNRDRIFSVNTSNGDTALVGATGLGEATPHLAFDGAGRLYAIIGTATAESRLYNLDTLTALANIIGPTGFTGINAITLRTDTLVVSVAEGAGSEIPESYALFQNYPNPFNPTTRIEYALPFASEVRLSIYNTLGQEVVRLVDDARSAGYHASIWNGQSSTGIPVSSGMYVYKIEATPLSPGTADQPAEPFITSKKMILLK